jgi:enamine deaminase RidA (YjgF/YER057c/UK114 family)
MNDASGDQKDVYPIGKKNPTLPFYPSVCAGDFIFVSGAKGLDIEIPPMLSPAPTR